MPHPPTPWLSRRRFLEGAIGVSAGLLLPARWARGKASEFELSEAARRGIAASPLIYVSPLRSDGSESVCHAEVWFVPDGADLLVVTTHDRWRAVAVRRGLDRARIWVGDFGPWAKSNGAFKSGPTFLANGVLVSKDAPEVERALKAFGAKYPDDWEKYGPRFRNGLEDGSRVMLRYRPAGA